MTILPAARETEAPWAPYMGAPATSVDIAAATFESAMAIRNNFWIEGEREKAYDERIAAIRDATGEVLDNPLRAKRSRLGIDRRPVGKTLYYALGISNLIDDEEQAFTTRLAELAERHPQHLGVIQPELPADWRQRQRAKLAETREQELWATRGGSPWTDPGGLAGSFAGGMAGMLLDPANAATMFLGPLRNVGLGVRPLLWSGVKQGVANAGVEALQAPGVQAWRQVAGLEHGLTEAGGDIGGAFLAGFGLDVVGRSAWRGFRRLQGRTPELDADGGVLRWQRPEDVTTRDPSAGVRPDAEAPARDPDTRLEEAAREMPADSLPRRALDGDDAALIELSHATKASDLPAVRGAVAELEHYKHWGDAPGVPKWEHVEALGDAIARTIDPDQPPAGPALRVNDAPSGAPPRANRADSPEFLSREAFAEAVSKGMVGPAEPQMADKFRALAGRDFSRIAREAVEPRGPYIGNKRKTQGVDLVGLDQGLNLGYRTEDIAHFLVHNYLLRNDDAYHDAHIASLKGQGDPPKFTRQQVDRVYDELSRQTQDSPAAPDLPPMRALSPEGEAARARLAAEDGSPVDLALVLREHPEAAEGLPGLTRHRSRQAIDIAALDEAAFRLVASGAIPPNHAALVGRHAGNFPQLHRAIVEDLARANLRNEAEVRLLIGEHVNGASAGQAGPVREVLGGVTARELAPERARVLAAGLKSIAKDGRVTAALVAFDPRAEGDAKVRKALATRLGDVVEALARADTEVGRLLDDAALAMRGGITHKQASAAFAGRLADLIERDGIAGLIGRETPGAAPRQGLDDPVGPDAKAQQDGLSERIKFSNPGDNDGRGSRNARGPARGDGQTSGEGGTGPGRTGAGGQQSAAERARQGFLARARGRDGGTFARRPEADGHVVSVFEERGPDGLARRTYWLHKDGAAGPSDKASPRVAAHMHDQLATWLSRLELREREPGRWEVAYVQTRMGQRMSGNARRLYDAVERHLGQPVIPSGQLTPQGLAFWKKRRPEWVEHYRYIEAQELYFSPREILDQLRIYQALLQVPDANRGELTTYRANLQDLRKALSSVPKAALKRAALAERWSMGWAPDLRPAAAVDWPAVRADVDRVISRLPAGVRAEVRDRIVFGGVARDGFWDPHERLIAIALNERAGATIRHEEVHTLRALGLIREAEWDTLAAYARREGLAEAYDVEGRWGEELRRTLGDDEPAVQAALLEETIAEMMGRHKFGERFGGAIDQVLARVAEFVERLGNLLAGRGFQSAHDVFRRIDSGEVARRPVAGGQPKAELETPGATTARAEVLRFQQQERPGYRPRINVRGFERIPLPDDLGLALGRPGGTVWIRVEHILLSRAAKGGAEHLDTPAKVQTFVRGTLEKAHFAYRYKKGETIYNFVHVLDDGSARIVSMDTMPNDHGHFKIYTAFPADRPSFLNKLSAAARMWGRDGFQILPGRQGALEGLLANVSEAHRATPGTHTATLIERLGQERRLVDEAAAKQAQAPVIDETAAPLVQRQAAEQAAAMQAEIDRAFENPGHRQWIEAEQLELFSDLAALCKR